MNDTMLMVHICQEFGWTYEEYNSQPTWFLTLIREKLKIDQKSQTMANKKMRHG